MASKQPRVPRGSSPQNADDFILIRGIGPTLASRLQKAGIRTYTELASMSPVELAAQVNGLSAKQVAQQDWIGQARKLARKMSKAGHHEKETARPILRQHYENFTIEFLLDGKNAPRRTRVLHVQSGDADTWAGWEAEHLIDFIARHANIRLTGPKRETLQITTAEGRTLPREKSASYTIEATSATPVPLFTGTGELAQSTVDLTRPVSQAPYPADLTGILRLCDLKAMRVDSDDPMFFIYEGEPYRLGLTLDLTELTIQNNISLRYKATIVCRQLVGSIHLEHEVSNTLNLAENTTIRIAGVSLPAGIYRLEAVASLTSNKATPGLTAFLKGGLLQVYETSLFHKSSESN